ncbi:RND family efflux transporter MFP subunit [Rhizobium sp. PP-F2F-G48]|uniref:efflux RND transporter periplasmic adaptor subunit n=1 Tax=Rhizobium sp. PP-F2F-G48 TaxID=2135651 RepID=UPI001043BB4F|nr:efflux RND transporter periplasmic adaptor subunit [Rhizobium sp. PP-F2F-G48]TCM58106.1 RND family efflux transporter MFP subunit [Rhizobium sp. PP-F2F-G48]
MKHQIDHPTPHALSLVETLQSFSSEARPASIPTRDPPRRPIIAIGVLVLMAGAGVALLFSHGADVFSGPTASPSRDQMAAPQSLPSSAPDALAPSPAVPLAVREITGSGFVVAEQGTRIFSRYEGRVITVAVDVGDLVRRGQVLVVLEDRDARFALEQAQAAQAAAQLQEAARRIDLSQAEAERDRTERLFASDAVSRQALDQARLRRDQAENAAAQARQAVESAGISLRIAQERLEEQTISAPFSGRVTGLSVHVGDTVLSRADSVREDQSLMMLTDMNRLAIDADVAETTVAALTPGLAGEAVLDAFPDKPFRVAIRRLAPVASAEKGTVALRLDLVDPPQGLRPNMAARIRIPIHPTGDIAP